MNDDFSSKCSIDGINVFGYVTVGESYYRNRIKDVVFLTRDKNKTTFFESLEDMIEIMEVLKSNFGFDKVSCGLYFKNK